ncbi:maestro heat-like repeat-containing protein family member 2A [Pteropus medius]|uniref:maestro heat-like repeat-containing protein family member 2A n=1 Tax=Pteropus vampyrus TaxID=132908 RepID=UPI00196A9537|nr:maestro heat-like repeat-containing protein family member 2A [Pteropus giganteus]
MAEAAIDSNEDLSEETEDPEPLEPDDGGTFQQVTNLLNIMDSESAKTDTVGAGPDMRKTLASVIITEKATAKPCVVMNALIRCLQVPKIPTQRTVSIYGILQEIIQQEGELEEQCVQRLVAIASKDMREILEMEGYMKAEVASDTLVALSRNHFSLVMYELQHHLKPLDLTDEFVIITLAKLAHGNVFEFMPYMGITLATIFTMLRLANEAKMRQVICAAMETFCQTVQFYLKHLEDSVYPVMTEDQFALKLFPMYRYFVSVWLRNHNPEVKLGVIKSLKPMLSLLLPNDDLREQVYDYIPLLLAEYQGSLEALFITQVLRQILEVSVTTSTLVPQMQLHTIFTELHVQVCTKAPAWQQYSGQNLTEVVHCFIALARSCPKELMKFFLSQMSMSKEAVHVGTLTLIRAVVSADEMYFQLCRPQAQWSNRSLCHQKLLSEVPGGEDGPQAHHGHCEDHNLLCQWHDQLDLPAPQKLLARLLVLMSSPYKGEGCEIAMVNLLSTLSHSIAPAMADTWELEIPLLVKYLEEHSEFSWNQKTWEDKLIQFLRNSLKKTRGSN